jgi:carboxypeptidase C (cathepsin A)
MRLLGLAIAAVLSAQPPATPAAKPAAAPPLAETKPVVRNHELAIGGRTLKYKSTTGLMALKADNGEIEANLFYTAYTLDPPSPHGRRPLTFCFNGGPGAGSVWLHLGAIGPKRVRMNDDGSLPPAPYQLVDNPFTWLDRSDLVFVDPVGTGFSRARSPEIAKKFFGLEGDIESVGRFIRLYLNENKRWSSPLFLAGESYGTTRASGLAGHLADRGIALNGVLLISVIMNFQTARFARGNDLPYLLFLPTYTAIAWYHKKLAADLQKDLKKAIDESRHFVNTTYVQALQKGDTLTPAERKQTLDQLVRLTGLERGWLERADLRIEIGRFCKELLRDRGLNVGRLDGRLTGTDSSRTGERPEFDPSLTAIRAPYTETMNQYAREELGYEDHREYYALGGGITAPWDFGVQGQGYADTSDALRTSMQKNPHMKVFIASGYYDLATPFHATEYTVSHMGLDAKLAKNIRWAEYESGHMMYIHVPSLAKFKQDVDGFYAFALPAGP